MTEPDHHAPRMPTNGTAPGDDPAGAAEPVGPAPEQQPQPERVGPYRVEREVGRGGMGLVLRVRDPAFQRTLAVKVLLGRYRGDPDAERRFLEEARLTG